MPSDPWLPYEESVQRQSIFLSNPLPVGEGVCATCRQTISGSWERCYRCNQHQNATSLTADAVVPIAYAIKRAQHAHNLATYKFSPGSQTAETALRSLGSLFLRDHMACLRRVVGGVGPLHLVMMPSTKGRQGPHPLDSMLGPIMQQVSRAPVNVNASYSDREFHADWFAAAPCQGQDVLILDDTWTTGSRIQSMSHALKTAGARSVVAVVLGRHIDPDWSDSKPLLERVKGHRFEPTRCALDG